MKIPCRILIFGIFQIILHISSRCISGQENTKIDIHTSIRYLTNTHKEVQNEILKSGIENGEHGYRHI